MRTIARLLDRLSRLVPSNKAAADERRGVELSVLRDESRSLSSTSFSRKLRVSTLRGVITVPSLRLCRVPAFCAITIAVLAFVGCGGGDGGEEATPGPLPPAADVLEGALARIDAMKTFHFRLEHENGASKIPLDLMLDTAEGDVVLPDRLYAKLEAKAGTQPVRVEVIGIGDDGWITNPFNREWQRLPSGTTIKDVFDPAQGVRAVATSMEGAKVTGEEEIDGADCYRVEGTVTSDVMEAAAPIAEPGLTITVRVWVDKEDSSIRRIRLEGRMAPDEPENIVRKLELSEFDESVEVTPPAE